MARLESLPCTADFSAAHFKFHLQLQLQIFAKQQKDIIGLLFGVTNAASDLDEGQILGAFCELQIWVDAIATVIAY